MRKMPHSLFFKQVWKFCCSPEKGPKGAKFEKKKRGAGGKFPLLLVVQGINRGQMAGVILSFRGVTSFPLVREASQELLNIRKF